MKQLNRKFLKEIIKSIIRESVEADGDTVYVEYLSQMRDEEPFEMNGQKFEYVWAKYPNGKKDIGVYAFSGDVVYGYKHFRKMYNLREDGGSSNPPSRKIYTSFQVEPYDLSHTSRDPDAEREYVFLVKKVVSDVQGDDYKEEVVGEYDTKEAAERAAYAANLVLSRKNDRTNPPQLKEGETETHSKRITGTVGVNGTEYDYSAVVTVNVMSAYQPHGEYFSEIDEEGVDIEIETIIPEPHQTVAVKVDEAIYDDVRGRNLWDIVNEADIKKQPVKENDEPTPIKAAKEWILDCAVNPEDEENIIDWLSTASDIEVKKYVNRTFDGGWVGFLRTL